MKDSRQKRARMPQMEGATARWYARLRSSGNQLEAYRKQAAQLISGLPDGADVLEVAPGPGYLAIEIARLGRFHLTGLDISHTFVQIATENARQAGVSVDFRHGNAESMPFDAESFDLIVCQAAFKNFTHPGRALDEMHRVLRSGGTAVIHDMNRDATGADIDQEVTQMNLSRLNTVMTRLVLTWLRRRAYTPAQLQRLAADSGFRTCDTQTDGIGMEAQLNKRDTV